jgi:hypothetical protein
MLVAALVVMLPGAGVGAGARCSKKRKEKKFRKNSWLYTSHHFFRISHALGGFSFS